MDKTEEQYPKNPLLGALELALFMKQSVERFHLDMNAMWRSFLVPIALTPLTFLMLYLSHHERPEISNLTYSEVAGLFFVKGLVGLALSLLILYGFAKAYDRLDRFYLTITAANWSSIIPTALFLPIMITYALGWYTWDDIYGISVILALYTYAITGFLLTYTFKIPWEMGGFLTVVLLAINETGFDIIYWLAS